MEASFYLGTFSQPIIILLHVKVTL